jgi:CheY-like chemotaxis protein
MIAKPFTYQALAEKLSDVLEAGLTGRLLVVENDATVRMFAVEALESAGLSADEMATASEALSRTRAAQGRYDAVILDAVFAGQSRPCVGGRATRAPCRHAATDASGEHANELHTRFASDRYVMIIEKPYNSSKLQAAPAELGVRRCGDPKS